MPFKILKFGAKWCSPCKVLDQELDKLEAKYDVQIERIDIEEDTEQARKYGVRSVPTLIAVNDSGVPGTQVGGVMSAERLASVFLGVSDEG